MESQATLADGGETLVIRIPMTFRRRSGGSQIPRPEGVRPQEPPKLEPPRPLVLALARAFRWQEMLESGEVKSVEELAKQCNIDPTYVGRILRLAALAPDIVEAILNGYEPDGLSINRLAKPLPAAWNEQRLALCFP
jgi:hypothetical protein